MPGKNGCDCADPDCELPMGRCFLCGQPTDKTRDGGLEFTVGTCCRRRVMSLYKREAAVALRVSPDSEGPGWAPFNDTGDAFEIQRDDGCGLFIDDGSAASHVACALGVTHPAYPEGA